MLRNKESKGTIIEKINPYYKLHIIFGAEEFMIVRDKAYFISREGQEEINLNQLNGKSQKLAQLYREYKEQ